MSDNDATLREMAEAMAVVLEGAEACGQLFDHEVDVLVAYREKYPKDTP